MSMIKELLSRETRDHPALKRPDDYDDINCRLLIRDLRSPINVGMILRVCETYRIPVAVHDGAGLFKAENSLKTISDFACGALQRQGVAMLEDGDADLKRLGETGRLVGMTIEPPSVSVTEFDFQRSDIFVVGNEYDGLPADFLRRCPINVTIPMEDVFSPKPKSFSPIDPGRSSPVSNDGKPNLNAAMSVGIICYSAFLAQR